MARYFFHVRGGRLDADDEEGIDLADDDAAARKALVGARSLIAAEVLEGRLMLGERIEVEDAAGRLVLSLPFAAAVDLLG